MATVLLLILLAYLLAKWTWLFTQPRQAITPPSSETISLDSVTERIVGAHLFGLAGERKSAEAAQVSTLNLRLKGVFAFSRDTPAFAIVNTGGRNDEAFKVGDEIQPGVKLDAVHSTHIVLQRGGAIERVNLEERPAGAPSARPPVRPSLPPPPMSGPAVAPAPAGPPANVSRSELQSAAQDPRPAVNLGRVNANAGGGLLMEEVPPGSLAQRLGLQPGDVVRSINGNAVNSPNDLIRLYQQIGQVKQINVEGARANRPLNLTYNVQP